MTERVYSISEAAAKVEVESHVLRYWEEELEIDIKRNDMGHRCYSEKDVKILQRVKTLKDKGIQLKAIKDMVHRMYELLDEGESTEEKNADDAVTELIAERENTEKKTIETIRVSSDVGDDSRIVDFKMAQFQNIMDKIISNSIKDNLKVITQSVSAAVSDDVVKQMDVLMKEKEDQEEARYRKLDATIRELQQTRQEVAATEIKRKKKGIFRRKQREFIKTSHTNNRD